MKKLNMLTIICLLSTIWLLPQSVLAHAELEQIMPGDGAVMNQSPDSLKFTFEEGVRLLKVTLTRDGSGEIKTGFKPSGKAAESFSVPLTALAQGHYQVSWAALGDDGHRVEGGYAFTVDADAKESMGHMAPMHHDADEDENQ